MRRRDVFLGALAGALCLAKPAAAEENADPSPPKLKLSVVERGPGLPWAMSLVNVGDGPAEISADPRLLWFEVEVPGKKKSSTCRLPGNLFPSRTDRRTAVVLAPDEGVEQSFDPRLYCFSAGGQWQLVPGAIVTPHFGWPEKKKVVWKKGKRSEETPKQSEPFVARRAPANGEPKLADPPGIKEVKAEPFSLRTDYVEWSRTRLDPDAAKVDEDSPMVMKTVQGSDASAERTATVRITITNRSKRTWDVYFRRELVSYEVMRPDGLATCDAQPDARAPDRQAFHRLRPKGSISVVSRLVELCPTGTFAQPGLYLVHARYDAAISGDEFGLDAFTGRVGSQGPATVRIRTGEQPFVQKKQMKRVKLARDKTEKP